jgi:NAD(P)-dependent dehydrogenase (short-subunit alcohol dehydrogenase family)
MTMLVDGKVAVVTGCAGGMGLSIGRTLAEHGAHIVAADLSAEKVEMALQSLKADGAAKVDGMVVDVASSSSVAAAFDALRKATRRVDILVNNAGVREIKMALDLSPEEWDRVIAINLNGPFYCARAAALMMREQNVGGSIINIASVAGLTAISHRPAYTAAKHGLVGLTKNLARDLAPYKIRVNAVAPGLVRTPLTDSYFQDEAFARGLRHAVPFNERGDAQDIANAVLYLASPLADFVNGVTLPVDGGFLAEKSYAAMDAKHFYSSEGST